MFFLLNACSTLPPKDNSPLYWPKPPAEPRLVYELTLRNQNSLNLKENEDVLREFAVGSLTSDIRALLKPYDIAAHGGLIVVSDSLQSTVHVFDVQRKKLYQIGWRGEGKLEKPLGLTVDKSQNIFVVDAKLGHVVKFNKLGHYLGTIGKREDFSRITDVAVDESSGRVYVLDRGGVESTQHRVVVYSSDGDRVMIVGTRGHNAGQFNHPNQIVVNQQGELYVLDAGNFRVQIFDEAGKHLRSWGRIGNQLGNFARPRGLAVDVNNHVYVTDSAFQNFQIFNQAGQLLLNVGDGGGQDIPGFYLLPAGIATDETGRIYVVDQIRRKIEIFRLLTDKERKVIRNKSAPEK